MVTLPWGHRLDREDWEQFVEAIMREPCDVPALRALLTKESEEGVAENWVDAAKARCRAATPGPWSVVGEKDLPDINDLMVVADGLIDEDGNEKFICNVDWTDDSRNSADARFISAARSDLPRALALIDKLNTWQIEAREALTLAEGQVLEVVENDTYKGDGSHAAKTLAAIRKALEEKL